MAKITEFAAIVGDKPNPLRLAQRRSSSWSILLAIFTSRSMPSQMRGGNGVPVLFLGSTRCGPFARELHGVWDTDLIKHTGIREHRYAAALETMIAEEHLEAGADTREQWADESLSLAKQAWVRPDTVIDETYCDREQPVVDRQLALAGLRLARMLNMELRPGVQPASQNLLLDPRPSSISTTEAQFPVCPSFRSDAC